MEGGTRVTNADILGVYTSHLRPYGFLALLQTLLLIGSVITEILAPTFYKTFFDRLASMTPNGAPVPELIDILLIVAALHIAGWIMYLASNWIFIFLQTRVMADLEQTAFGYLIRHSYQFFSNAFSGSLVRKVTRLPRAYEGFMDAMQFTLIPLIVSTVGVMIVLWSRNPMLAWVMIGWTLFFLAYNYTVARWRQKYLVERAIRDTELTGAIADSVSNSHTVQLFSGYRYEQILVRAASEALRKIRHFTWKVGEWNNRIQHLFMITIEFVILFLSLSYWQQGLLTLGDFVLIQGLLLTLFNKLWDFGRVVRDVYESFADAEEMVTILKTPHEIRDGRHAKALRVSKGKILFENVLFTYNRTRKILNGFNLTIKPHEKVALVGPSGAGKSTITKLLLRLHDIDRGLITIDGQDIARVTQESLRNAVSLVPQEPVLFHRSILENIRYGNREATDIQVIEAAEKARCHEFIMDLPNGYNTFVGERGVKLSGGERQRVAIARAILKNAPILILDEATSSLDSGSESLIQEALQELMKGKTTIVIAHRLSTIMKMDRIVIIEGGAVTASGTHKELIRKKGAYKTLWNIQAGGFLP